MPKLNVKEKNIEPERKTFQEPHPRKVFVEKYRAAGYNASDTEGVLMFTGDYKIKDIGKMLAADGYRGSFGVRSVSNV